jgi:regulator of sigma E protease
MLTVVAFIVALGLLIAVHEYGHYRVAVACRVKVLRFSVGFGKTLYSWKPRKPRPGQDTEFVIGAFPLGGYVKMLDEREGPVDAAERHRAFNTQPLGARAAIVAAGPAANLLLAVLLYALVNWMGVQEPQAILGTPVVNSIAADAGLRGGERVASAALEGDAVEPVRSFEELRWLLTRGALDGRDLRLVLQREGGGGAREVLLPLSRLEARDADAQLLRKVGILAPWSPPVLGEVMARGAAERAGLKKGDVVLRVGEQPVGDAQQLRDMIRAQVQAGRPVTATWQIERQGQRLQVPVTPDLVADPSGAKVARIAAFVGAPPAMVTVRRGPLEGLWNGAVRTWDVSALTLRMMGRMVVGEASVKNLSGPLTIADYAGKSASLGLTQYLLFLALISVSLGVLNLLPLPVLDGGHLMYYLFEAVTGRPPTDVWLDRLTRGGFAIMIVMMSLAFYNDLVRYLGPH